jgi:hypothetical protein
LEIDVLEAVGFDAGCFGIASSVAGACFETEASVSGSSAGAVAGAVDGGAEDLAGDSGSVACEVWSGNLEVVAGAAAGLGVAALPPTGSLGGAALEGLVPLFVGSAAAGGAASAFSVTAADCGAEGATLAAGWAFVSGAEGGGGAGAVPELTGGRFAAGRMSAVQGYPSRRQCQTSKAALAISRTSARYRRL